MMTPVTGAIVTCHGHQRRVTPRGQCSLTQYCPCDNVPCDQARCSAPGPGPHMLRNSCTAQPALASLGQGDVNYMPMLPHNHSAVQPAKGQAKRIKIYLNDGR